MVVVTGATGKLGGHVVRSLLAKMPAAQIVAVVRNRGNADGLAELGVQVRQANYSEPATLASALAGAEKVLLISSNEVGQRVPQHQAVIDASVTAKVKLFAYTSILRADTSELGLAVEHRATEEAIQRSGLTYVLLRNGWYLENHTEALGPAMEHGAILGAAGNGKFASAARADYAAAASVVLTEVGHENKTYELAGDDSYTLAELAAEVSRLTHKAVAYRNLAEGEYEQVLLQFGLPAPIAKMLADSDSGAANGALDSKARDLHDLLGRSTTTLAQAVSAAVTV